MGFIKKINYIGSLHDNTLEEIWNNDKNERHPNQDVKR